MIRSLKNGFVIIYRVVTAFQVAKLFGIAYTKAAIAQKAINGFKKTGLFPTNRNIFEPHGFAPC